MTAETRIISGTHATYDVDRCQFILRFDSSVIYLHRDAAPIRCTPCRVTFSPIWLSL